MSGFVYVIEAPGAFKVGTARDVSTRLKALQTSHPDLLLVRGSWEAVDPRATEAYIHRSLKSYRLRGEWFQSTATEELERVIESLLREGRLVGESLGPSHFLIDDSP